MKNIIKHPKNLIVVLIALIIFFIAIQETRGIGSIILALFVFLIVIIGAIVEYIQEKNKNKRIV